MKKYTLKNNLIIFVISLSLTGMVFAPLALAQEIVISSNGDGSSNEVHITENNQTNTEQTNNAVITNTVNTTADTGNNTADNNNNIETNINTGNASLETDITNQANISATDQSCCITPAPNSINISGNGSDSQNNTVINSASTTSITVIQNVSILNNITETANTGNNNAGNNNGNVNIMTGNINSDIKINNGLVNSTQVNALGASNDSYKIDIAGNDNNSVNNIALNLLNSKNIITDNASSVINNLNSLYNTGNNTANGNNGEVFIRTGDIISSISINNALNTSKADLNCCLPQEKENPAPKGEQPASQPQPQPTPNLPPAQPTPTNPTVIAQSGASNPPTQIGQVAAATAAAISKILPVTGNNWFYISLLGSFLMFFLGAYLRLRSGNSPGLTLAF